jgi:hypothetical protein
LVARLRPVIFSLPRTRARYPGEVNLGAPTNRLVEHPVYRHITCVEHLRVFMEHHVVCVWDFMSLLKSLQHDLAGTSVPWVPPADPAATRLINEIVLDEECDEIDGEFLSHYELYLRGMDEIGADTGPMRGLVSALMAGTPIVAAMSESGLPRASELFLATTLEVLYAPTYVRAAVFFFGRERVIPRMFDGVQRTLKAHGLQAPSLHRYLERPVELDGARHGPRSERLALGLCGDDPDRLRVAHDASLLALHARLDLWDAIDEVLTRT